MKEDGLYLIQVKLEYFSQVLQTSVNTLRQTLVKSNFKWDNLSGSQTIFIKYEG